MPDEKLDPYNPNYTHKKHNISLEKDSKIGYPVLEKVNNAALFPENIKNSVDMEQLKPFH